MVHCWVIGAEATFPICAIILYVGPLVWKRPLLNEKYKPNWNDSQHWFQPITKASSNQWRAGIYLIQSVACGYIPHPIRGAWGHTSSNQWRVGTYINQSVACGYIPHPISGMWVHTSSNQWRVGPYLNQSVACEHIPVLLRFTLTILPAPPPSFSSTIRTKSTSNRPWFSSQLTLCFFSRYAFSIMTLMSVGYGS